MRWNEDNKDILWNTIFKTQSFHLDLDTISAEWTGDEKPTPKAIKEFLGRYRKSLGVDNRITFGMSAKRTAEDGIPTGKPRKKAATSATTTTSSGGGTQKNKAAPKPRGRAAAAAKGKGRDVNLDAKGKKKKQPQDEEDEEHESGDKETEHDDDDDDDDEALAIKQEAKEESMPEDAQQGMRLPQVVIKREVNVEDEYY